MFRNSFVLIELQFVCKKCLLMNVIKIDLKRGMEDDKKKKIFYCW